MSRATFDFFYFYDDYLWRSNDFANFQATIQKYVQESFKAGFQNKILSGLDFVSASNLTITVRAGGAISNVGNPLILTSNEDITLTGPTASEGVKSYVVIRETSEDINVIQEPTNPTNMVPLNKSMSSILAVVAGTPSASPVYPALTPGETVLFGIFMPANTTTITSAMLDYSVSSKLKPSSDIVDRVKYYDAIVSSDKSGTHKTLAEVFLDPNIANIKKVLVKDNYTVNTVIAVNQPNMLIEFVRGVSYIKGTAANALNVTAPGVEILNGRFQDFSGVSDVAILWSGDYGYLIKNRFKSCTKNFTDTSTNGLLAEDNITE